MLRRLLALVSWRTSSGAGIPESHFRFSWEPRKSNLRKQVVALAAQGDWKSGTRRFRFHSKRSLKDVVCHRQAGIFDSCRLQGKQTPARRKSSDRRSGCKPERFTGRLVCASKSGGSGIAGEVSARTRTRPGLRVRPQGNTRGPAGPIRVGVGFAVGVGRPPSGAVATGLLDPKRK